MRCEQSYQPIANNNNPFSCANNNNSSEGLWPVDFLDGNINHMYRNFNTNSPSSSPTSFEENSSTNSFTPACVADLQSTTVSAEQSDQGVMIQVPQISLNNPIYGVGVSILNEMERHKKQNGHKKDSTESDSKLKSDSRQSSSEAVDRKKRLTMPLIYRMYESVSEELRGTVNGPDDDDFRPEEASKNLREALNGGIQSSEKAIINILLAHNNFQRQKIVAAYEGMYNRTLSSDIEEEAGGYFLDAVLALVQPAHIYSAKMLYHSISGRTHSRSTAVEIALTSSASQLKVIRDAYQAEFRVSLERDLNMKVEGLFGKMLLQLLLRSKDFDEEVDMELADDQVALLLSPENTGIEEIGRNLDLFNKLFGAQGLNQIRTFFQKYDIQALHGDLDARGKDFESIVRKSVTLHSDVRQMILLFVRISKNMQLYFAEKLFEAISGTRPDHSSIIRILVSRSEIDLSDICSEYRRRYGHHIVYDLQSTCSGDFLRLLNQLVNPMDFDDVFVE